MKLIEPDEKARFAALLKSRSMSEFDFELREVDITDPKSDELWPVKGYVEVRRRSTNKTRDYPIGDGTAWTIGFEHDLENRCFD